MIGGQWTPVYNSEKIYRNVRLVTSLKYPTQIFEIVAFTFIIDVNVTINCIRPSWRKKYCFEGTKHQ
jgi:hypothetical protein